MIAPPAEGVRVVQLALIDEVAAFFELLANDFVRVLEFMMVISRHCKVDSLGGTYLDIQTFEVAHFVSVVALFIEGHGWHLITLNDL